MTASRGHGVGRRGFLALALPLAVTVSGCATIPRSGPVTAGQPDTTEEDIPFQFLPNGPAEGATQKEILDGFIDAASSPQDNYRIAREFLSTDAEWIPGTGVIVDQGLRTQTVAGEDAITLAVTPVAEVDETGAYSEVASASPLPLQYSFVQENGEWRISSPPSGVLIDRSTFDQVFSTYPLYFFDPTTTYLVPDVRWFASRGDSSTSTTIVTELLRGPSPWLAETGSAVSAFPTGTALGAESVPVVGQDASVDLNSAVLESSARERALMRLQLKQSLQAVSNVSGVTITVDQAPFDAATTATGLPTTPRVDARPLVLLGDSFGFLSGDAVSSSPLESAIAPLGAVAVTLSAGQDAAAVQDAGGAVSLVRDGQPVQRLDARAGLVAPTMDPLGYVWTVPSDAPGQVTAFSPDGSRSIPVTTAWPEADGITALRVSREGSRVVALVTDGAQTSLLVASVERSDSGAPVSLGERQILATLAGEPVDATWLDDVDVAFVVRATTGEDTVWQQQLGGKRTSLGTTTGTARISGGNAATQIRILSSEGELRQQRGSAWQTTATGIAVLGTQTGIVS
jgi:hypothetical protein